MTLTRRQWLLLAAITLLWGSNWPMMKFSLREVGPLWFRALTMAGGVLALLLWFLLRGIDFRLPRAQAGRVLALALPNVVGWHLGSIVGLTYLAAGRASILAFTMPVWTVLLGALLFGHALTRRAGVASVAALGAVVLLAADELGRLAGQPVGVAWLQFAAASWAFGTLLLRRLQVTLATETLALWMMAFGAVFFFTVAPLFEALPDPRAWSAAGWASLAWGAFVNFGISQVLWFTLARELPAQASSFSLMAVPLVGVLSSALLVGEVPRASDWLAVLFIAVAIAAATGAVPARGSDNARR